MGPIRILKKRHDMRILYLLLFMAPHINAGWNITYTAGIGPAWHRYNYFELFKVPIMDRKVSLFPTAEYLQTPYILMPYFEGSAQLKVHNFFLRGYAGGGFVSRGIGTAALPFSGIIYENSNLFRQELPTLTKASIAIIDASIGCIFSPHACVSISPLVGYFAAVQRPLFYIYDVDTTFKHRNVWRGAAFGFNVTCSTHCISGEFIYKFSPAHLSTIIQVNSPPNLIQETIFLSDATYSTACGRAWMNELQFKGWYNRECSRFGAGFTYLQCNNADCLTVNLGSTNTFGNPETGFGLIQGSTLPKIIWQQIIITVSGEIYF